MSEGGFVWVGDRLVFILIWFRGVLTGVLGGKILFRFGMGTGEGFDLT